MKVLVIPNVCPTCGHKVEVDRSADNWAIVRCTGKMCNWWTQGRVEE